MSFEAGRLLTDRGYLTQVQYRTQHNLAARQSIYAYQRPLIDLASAVISLAGMNGSETVADIGCGNGVYLGELARRGHAGRVLGADLSAGMLAAARDTVAAASRGGSPTSGLVLSDAAALPLADGVADITLAPHMLYHVADRQAAVREFRRVTRPGGAVLVVLNGSDHFAELRDLVNMAAADIGMAADAGWAEGRAGGPGLILEAGAELLGSVFGSIFQHDFVGELVVPDPQPVLDYVASMRFTQSLAEPSALLAALSARLPGGSVTITTHCGALVCR